MEGGGSPSLKIVTVLGLSWGNNNVKQLWNSIASLKATIQIQLLL